MRDPRNIADELLHEKALCKTARNGYARNMNRAMYTNYDDFDTLDDFTSVNIHQDTISELKKELNASLPLQH